ncbi:sodium-dependent bicarbonate transport family permease [Ignavibacteriales bacterium]
MLDILANGLINLKNPAILFFLLGLTVALIRSELKIPEPIIKMFSYYLMASIGFKGGYEISKTGFNPELTTSVILALLIAGAIPVMAFYILRGLVKLDSINAGALASHYGSVSVVTFVTAISYLDRAGIEFGGFMVGVMALMEFPAILVGIGLAIYYTSKSSGSKSLKGVIFESITNESVILLGGSLVIGIISAEKGYALTKPFFVEPFQGVLTFFLLDMGIVAGRKLHEFRKVGVALATFAIVFPIFNGLLGTFLATVLGLSLGNTVLFGILAASSSYIAAPAAVRIVLPEANPSIYLTSSLAITFPFNIILGIPFYFSMADLFSRLLH